MRGFELFDIAMKIMTPIEPSIGTAIVMMFMGPCPSTTSGGGWIVMVPCGSFGRSTFPERGVGTLNLPDADTGPRNRHSRRVPTALDYPLSLFERRGGGNRVRASYATATLCRDDRTFDIAVPAGTTLSGVLAQLGGPRQPGLIVVDELGREIDGAETFGGSIPAGASLFVRGAELSSDRAKREQARTRRRGFDVPTIGALAACVVLSPVLALTPQSVPWPARIAITAILLLFALALSIRPASQPRWHLLVAPVAVAAAAGAAVPHPPLIAAWSFALVFAWAGTLMALGLSSRDRGESLDAATTLWLLPAIALSLVSITHLPSLPAACFALAAGVTLLALSPSVSVRIPDHQLLNLPVVLRTAPAVHQPTAPAPARVTPSRVRRTIRLGSALRTVLIMLAAILVLSGTPRVVTAIAFSTIEGWGAVALLTLSFGFFALQPRNARPPAARWMPRIVAVVMIMAAVWMRPGELAAWWIAGAIVIAITIIIFGVLMGRGLYAPLLTRLGDVAERITLALAVPAAIVAAGGVSIMRAM